MKHLVQIVGQILEALSNLSTLLKRSSCFFGTNDGTDKLPIPAVLQKYDLGMSRAASSRSMHIDLCACRLATCFEELFSAARASETKIYVYHLNRGWRRVSAIGLFRWRFGARFYKNIIHLAVTDQSDRLIGRYAIHLWDRRDQSLVSRVREAPIQKRFALQGVKPPTLPEAKTDLHIEPIDVVYTWVNGRDAGWLEQLSAYRDVMSVDQDRFTDADELRYSLRSLFIYAPWVRNVYILSNCRPPEWLAQSSRVRWVLHSDLIDQTYLPLFNSHAIETFLHKIPDLAEQFIYFNDDMFLAAPVEPSDFFDCYGHSVSRMEPHGLIPYFNALAVSGRAEEWQLAAVNGADLQRRKTGVQPLKLHHHAPYALKRSVLDRMELEFAEAFEDTRNARFRSSRDISVTSFLYHHYARYISQAHHIDEECITLNRRNFKRVGVSSAIKRCRFICINDGGGSISDISFQKYKNKIMKNKNFISVLAEL